MRTINTLLPLALALAGPCGFAPSFAAFSVDDHRTAVVQRSRSGDSLLRRPRLCAGQTDEQLGVTEIGRRAISLGRTDLPAALAYIEANDPPDQQFRAKWALMYRLSQDDLGFLFKVPSVLGEPVTPPPLAPPPAPYDSQSALEDISKFWVSKDHDKIFKAVQDSPPSPLKTRLRSILAPMLVPVDFSQAIAFFGALPDSEKTIDSFTRMVSGYRGNDPSELLNWTRNFPPGWAAIALGDLAVALKVGHDLARLEKLSIAEPLPRNSIVLIIFGSALAEDDPDHVVARVDALATTPEKKEAILTGALQSIPISKNREVAARLLESIHQETRAAAFSRSIPRIFSSKPDEAIRLAMTAPEDVRPAALQALVIEWYHTDPAGLAGWIYRLPKGGDRSLVEKFQLDLIVRANKDKAIQDATNAGQLPPPPAK